MPDSVDLENAIHFQGRDEQGREGWIRFAWPRHGEQSSVCALDHTLELQVSETNRGKLLAASLPCAGPAPTTTGAGETGFTW